MRSGPYLVIFFLGFLLSHPAKAQEQEAQKLHHVLLLDWKANADTSIQSQVRLAFKEMTGEIEGLNSLSIRPSVAANFELDWVVHMVFDSESALEIYQEHPSHLALRKMATPQLAGLKKYDYWD